MAMICAAVVMGRLGLALYVVARASFYLYIIAGSRLFEVLCSTCSDEVHELHHHPEKQDIQHTA